MSPVRIVPPKYYVLRGVVGFATNSNKKSVMIDTIRQVDWQPENGQKTLLRSVRIIGTNKQGRQLFSLQPYCCRDSSTSREESKRMQNFVATFAAKASLDKIKVLYQGRVFTQIDRSQKPRGQLHAQAVRQGVKLEFMAECERLDIWVKSQVRGSVETRQVFSRDGGSLDLNKTIIIPWEKLPLADKVIFEVHIQKGLNHMQAITPVVKVVQQAIKTRVYCTGLAQKGNKRIIERGTRRVRNIPVYQMTMVVKASLHGKDLPASAIQTVVQGKTYSGKLFQMECEAQDRLQTKLQLKVQPREIREVRHTLDVKKIKRDLLKP
jgi:hypothetical protein